MAELTELRDEVLEFLVGDIVDPPVGIGVKAECLGEAHGGVEKNGRENSMKEINDRDCGRVFMDRDDDLMVEMNVRETVFVGLPIGTN